VDFKGRFSLGNAQRCDPLTVCDRFSRYLFGCRAQSDQQFKRTLRAFRGLMRQGGMPEDHPRRSRLAVCLHWPWAAFQPEHLVD
jgi:hypothetical protein